ncbi:MAG: 50S ribosomal protein L29 [Chloroflexota bacterium]
MKPAQIRSMTDEALDAELKSLQSEWRDLRFQESVGQLTATARIGQIRRDIARIHTIRTERRMDSDIRALLNEQGITPA